MPFRFLTAFVNDRIPAEVAGILRLQVMVTGAIGLALALLHPQGWLSGVLGSLVCLVVTTAAALQVRWAGATDSLRLWRRMISMQVRKVVLTAILFVVVFIIYNGLDILIFMISFLACQAMYGVALLRACKNK